VWHVPQPHVCKGRSATNGGCEGTGEFAVWYWLNIDFMKGVTVLSMLGWDVRGDEDSWCGMYPSNFYGRVGAQLAHGGF
jgi:hypothetical protein